MPCNDANAIPTRSRYAGTYAVAIAGRYGWAGLGGQRMGCEWLAGLVSRAYLYVNSTDGRGYMGSLGLGCEWLAGLVREGWVVLSIK